MKFGYVIIYVDDVQKAAAFYQDAFGLTTRFIHESGTYAEMESGDTVLAFANNDMLKMHTGIDAQSGTKNCFEIAFTTTDVNNDFARALKYGAIELRQPEEKPWGQTVAYVQDLFGTIIEICTPMA